MKALKYIFFILAVGMLSACGDSFWDVNKDPNNPAESTLSLTLPTAESSYCYAQGGWYQIAGGIWSQYWTQANGAGQYAAFDNWQVTTNTLSTQYFYIWTESLGDLDYVATKAKEEENGPYYLISKTMEAYIFQRLVDLYDQQPYSEALKGDLGNIQPHYQDGQVIYDSLMVSLDNAYSYYQEHNSGQSVDGDLFFNGDMNAWVKFMNTLKLKILLRQSFVPGRDAYVKQQMQKLFSGSPAFLTDDAVQMTQFGSGTGSQNPYYATEVQRFGNVNVVASKNTIDFLKDAGAATPQVDPRMQVWFAASESGNTYVGQTQGDNRSNVYSSDNDFSKPVIGATDPVTLMSSSEANFLLAEAALRYPTETGLGAAAAQSYYEAGIDASFSSLGLNVASAQALYAPGARYAYPNGTLEENLNAIITQKWISMTNTEGMEAYIEQKRTGYPKAEWDVNSGYILTIPVQNVSGNRPVKRLVFNDVEIQTNPNTPDVKDFSVPVWWDVRDAN